MYSQFTYTTVLSRFSQTDLLLTYLSPYLPLTLLFTSSPICYRLSLPQSLLFPSTSSTSSLIYLPTSVSLHSTLPHLHPLHSLPSHHLSLTNFLSTSPHSPLSTSTSSEPTALHLPHNHTVLSSIFLLIYLPTSPSFFTHPSFDFLSVTSLPPHLLTNLPSPYSLHLTHLPLYLLS